MNNGELIYKDEHMGKDGVLHYKLVQKVKADRCPSCGSANSHVNEYTTKKVIDLDEDDNKIIYEITHPRFRCGKCGKTWRAPIPGGESRGGFTSHFTGYVADEVIEKGRPIKEVAAELDIPFSTARKIVMDEFKYAEEKHVYSLPRRLLLDRVTLKGQDVYLLVDLQKMHLLDILDRKAIEQKPDRDNVVELYVKGKEDGLENSFSNAEVRKYRPQVFQAGVRALLREAREAGLDPDEVQRFLDEDDDELLGELAVQSLKIIPIKIAYDFLLENKDNVEKLRAYDGELDGFRDFASNIEEGEVPEGFFPEAYDAFCRALESFEEDVLSKNRTRNTFKNIRDMVLFSGNPTYPIGLEEKEKDRSFGKPIPIFS